MVNHDRKRGTNGDEDRVHSARETSDGRIEEGVRAAAQERLVRHAAKRFASHQRDGRLQGVARVEAGRGMGGPSEAGAGAELLRDAVIVEMRFYRVRPKSHYRSGKNSHLLKPGAPPVPTHKPDVLKAMPATRKGSGGQRMLFATKGGA